MPGSQPGHPHTYRPYDDVLVQAVVAGQLAENPYPADAEEIVRRLVARKFSDGQIAFRLGRTKRTVERIRRRLGIPAALRPGCKYPHYSVAHFPSGERR